MIEDRQTERQKERTAITGNIIKFPQTIKTELTWSCNPTSKFIQTYKICKEEAFAGLCLLLHYSKHTGAGSSLKAHQRGRHLLGVVMQICNSSTQEADTGGGSLSYLPRLLSQRNRNNEAWTRTNEILFHKITKTSHLQMWWMKLGVIKITEGKKSTSCSHL